MAQVEILSADDPRAGWRLSRGGVPYWLPKSKTKMPVLSTRYLESIVFVTHGVDDAEGGSGFILGVKSLRRHDRVLLLVVTNAHVLPESGSVNVHLNRPDHRRDQVEITADKWLLATSDDLAVAPFEIADMRFFRMAYIPLHLCISEDMLGTEDGIWAQRSYQHVSISLPVGLMSDVIMLGRFSAFDDPERVRPVLRMGNISMLPAQVPFDGLSFLQEAFFVEMRSVAGFSGSPVFVFPNQPIRYGPSEIENQIPNQLPLLGIEVGNFEPRSPVSGPEGILKGLYTEANAGQTVVIPAWRLKAFIETPDVQRVLTDMENAEDEREGKNPLKLS